MALRPEDSELSFRKFAIRGGRKIPVITRSGMPQGLSISPILSTAILTHAGPPKGLFMYADDGIYRGNPLDREYHG